MSCFHCLRIAIASLLCFTVASFSGLSALNACTLWSAVGKRAAHGGSLIAKNRDWNPEPSEVRLIKPETGFRCLGLYPIRDRKKTNVVAGVNEKGLAVVTATASSLPQGERDQGGRSLTQQLLNVFPAVEAVLENKAIFSRTHPVMYLIADRRQAAWIEVAPGGKFAVRSSRNGSLYHTNHYLDEALAGLNSTNGRNSKVRLNRIGELLIAREAPLTLEDFIAFSHDQSNGPDDSLWRTGSKPEGKRTLASWIVSLPLSGPPELFVRMANPGESERQTRVVLDEGFWEGRPRTLF